MQRGARHRECSYRWGHNISTHPRRVRTRNTAGGASAFAGGTALVSPSHQSHATAAELGDPIERRELPWRSFARSISSSTPRWISKSAPASAALTTAAPTRERSWPRWRASKTETSNPGFPSSAQREIACGPSAMNPFIRSRKAKRTYAPPITTGSPTSSSTGLTTRRDNFPPGKPISTAGTRFASFVRHALISFRCPWMASTCQVGSLRQPKTMHHGPP